MLQLYGPGSSWAPRQSLGCFTDANFPSCLIFFFFKLKFKLPFSLKIEIIFVNLKFAVAFWSIRGKFIYILETQELIIGA